MRYSPLDDAIAFMCCFPGSFQSDGHETEHTVGMDGLTCEEGLTPTHFSSEETEIQRNLIIFKRSSQDKVLK